MKATIGCLLGLVFSLTAAAEPLIEGRVLLTSGAPAAGAQVRLFDRTDLRAAPLAATTDRAGQFTLPLGHPCGGPAGALRTGGELSQSVQSRHDDSLPAADGDVRAAGGVQPPGSAHCHAGGWGTAGRFSHRTLGRHRCGRTGGGRRGVSVPAPRRGYACNPSYAADRRAGGDSFGGGRVARPGKAIRELEKRGIQARSTG